MSSLIGFHASMLMAEFINGLSIFNYIITAFYRQTVFLHIDTSFYEFLLKSIRI